MNHHIHPLARKAAGLRSRSRQTRARAKQALAAGRSFDAARLVNRAQVLEARADDLETAAAVAAPSVLDLGAGFHDDDLAAVSVGAVTVGWGVA